MTHIRFVVLALTVSGALACSDSRNLIGASGTDSAAGSGGSLVGVGGGSGMLGNGGIANSGGTLASGGVGQTGGAVASGGVATSGGILGSGGNAPTGGAVASGGRTGTGGTASSGGAIGGRGGSGAAGGNDASFDGTSDVAMSGDTQALAELCTSTGGKVEPLECCANAGDFPNSCLGGACGCAPEYSHTVTVCTCPTSTCFQATTGCVPRGTGGAGGGSGGSGSGGSGGGGSGGGGGSADAAKDVSGDGQPAACPTSIPSGSCSVSSSTICYYGDDARWFCKTSAKCSQGTWQVTQPLTGCTTAPDPGCPADPTSPPATICSADGGIKATCVYSTQFCTCGYTGGPNPGWVCSKNLPAECPALPPGEGSPCTTSSGVWCTYGTSCSGHDMQCFEGKWVTLLLAC